MEGPRSILELKKIASLMTTDSDLWVVPRYERLHLINILAIQRQMSALERDVEDAADYENRRNRTQVCSSPTSSSEEVLSKLQDTIKKYDDAILAFAAIRRTEDPAQHVLKGLKMEANDAPLPGLNNMLKPQGHPNDQYQRDHDSHLLSIATGSRSWFHRCVERHDRLGRLFQAKHRKDDGGKNFRKFPEHTLRNVEFGIVATFLCLVQLLPVLALTLVPSKAARLAVIIILIVMVSLLNALFANTVRSTNFGAIAAYSAIVVVFVSQDK
ncbi:hypothetical protein GQ44DRAFT_795282 [Phaeosphaeriaceae sp. PMI808]|nr:hypothetical protein GQ44DRAFT_795282 [Phaeosphaeriaceae sp. PMI808]